MKTVMIDDLKISEEVKEYWKGREIFDTQQLAHVFLDERGKFDEDLFNEMSYRHKYSTKDENALKRAIYKSGEYRDLEGRPADPIMEYYHLVESRGWRLADGASMIVYGLNRLKEELLIKRYNTDGHIESETKVYLEEGQCEQLFRFLDVADWDAWESNNERIYALDAPRITDRIVRASRNKTMIHSIDGMPDEYGFSSFNIEFEPFLRKYR